MLPIVLAGPIIRKVGRHDFWIWIATSIECKLHVVANVYAPKAESATGFARTGAKFRSSQQSLRAGKNVVVSLLRSSLLEGELPAGGYVEYSVESIDENVRVEQSIQERCRRVALSAHRRLFFFLPFVGEDKGLELRHLSCRRLRRSRNDTIRSLASELRRLLKTNEAFPALLVLGGDQIYSDDVDDATLRQIKEWRPILFGNTSPSGTRLRFIEEAKLSATNCKNHLVDLEELVCLYLIGWSSELARGEQSRDILKEVDDWQTVMAHIPTYMIFDDHDVTDDWFLDTKWKCNVLGTKIGKRYIEEALVAYFIFQGWGNNPDQFKSTDVAALAHWISQRPHSAQDSAPIVDTATWTFRVESDWLIICLDCRTRRLTSKEWTWFEYYDEGTKQHRSPALEPLIIAPSELELARNMALPSARRKNYAILVVNTPVFGLPIVGILHDTWRKLSSLGSKRYARNLNLALDPESWDIDPASWIELVRNFLFATSLDKWVIVAGDVHYSFVAEGEFKVPSGKTINCLQVTSSPSNNETPYLNNLNLLGAHKPVFQAVWEPQSGLSSGTVPMQSETAFSALVKRISERTGRSPYTKKWVGLTPVPGRNSVATWNAYASVRISLTAVNVTVVNMAGETEREFLWR